MNELSDDGLSFFFVDTIEGTKGYSGTHDVYSAKSFKTANDLNRYFKEINADEYEVRKVNNRFALYENGGEVATSATVGGIYEEFRDWTGIGLGSANYKVYLNLTNPLIVDAEYDKSITVADVDILRLIGRNSVSEFTSEDIQKSQKWAHKFYKEIGIKSPFFRAWFGDWRAFDENKVNIVKENRVIYSSGKSTNIDVNEFISWDGDFKRETINHASKDRVSIDGLGNINDIVENVVLLDTAISLPTSKTKMNNTAFMHSFYTLYKDAKGDYSLLKLFVEEALSNNNKAIFKRAYQLKDIQKIANIPNGVLSKVRGLTVDTFANKFK